MFIYDLLVQATTVEPSIDILSHIARKLKSVIYYNVMMEKKSKFKRNINCHNWNN